MSRTYDLVLSQVLSGLPPGSRLVEADLVRQLSASRTTVRKVLARMTIEGLLVRAPRSGTFIRPPKIQLGPDLRALWWPRPRGDNAHIDAVVAELIPAPPIIRSRLFADADRVLLLEGRLCAGPRQVGLVVAYLGIAPGQPLSTVDAVGHSGGLSSWLSRSGLDIVDTRVRMTILPAADESARDLGLDHAAPVLWLENDLLDASGRCRAVMTVRCDGSQVTVGPVEFGLEMDARSVGRRSALVEA
ncbi:GntR family transcriptional regulator [Nocardia sp. NPDC058379]|uniref:GntR family transcriptional regulator n=1 Tax=unclassified Nocardia TaxID=2637762 RepID=UPI003655DE25